MENYRLPIWIASILGCMLIVFVTLLNFHQFQLIRTGTQFLSVSATAKTESIQDIAIVTVGVLSEGSTAQGVKNQNTNKMNQVITFIKQAGIEDKDIKTSQFFIAPNYSYINQQQTLIGYQANQTVTVKVRQIDKSLQQLQTIVDGAVKSGANQIQGIEFSFDNNESLIQDARKLAIDKAKANAQQIAKDAGLKLGRLVNVVTSNSSNAGVSFSPRMALAKADSSQIQLGSQEIFETVTLVFEIG